MFLSVLQEGAVSTEIVRLRVALDYPVVADSTFEVIDSYLNMSLFLASPSQAASVIVDLDNSLDIYWPLPSIYWSALPVVPIMRGLMRRFVGGPVRKNAYWLTTTGSETACFDAHGKKRCAYDDTRIHLGILGGHMNNHPIGQMILYRLLVRFKRYIILNCLRILTNDSI